MPVPWCHWANSAHRVPPLKRRFLPCAHRYCVSSVFPPPVDLGFPASHRACPSHEAEALLGMCLWESFFRCGCQRGQGSLLACPFKHLQKRCVFKVFLGHCFSVFHVPTDNLGTLSKRRSGFRTPEKGPEVQVSNKLSGRAC